VIDITGEKKGYFWTTLHEARIGEQIVYTRGSSCTGVHRHDAMQASDEGLVSLVQKRNGPSDFSYIAQKIKPRKKP
jgi:hypothetical protein